MPEVPLPENYVTVVFNGIHVKEVSDAMIMGCEFNIPPYDLGRFGIKAAIVQCPATRAQAQADRYTSFMFGSRVFPTLDEAKTHLADY